MIFKKGFVVVCILSLVLVSLAPLSTQASGQAKLENQGFFMNLPAGFSRVEYDNNIIKLYGLDDAHIAEIGFFDVPVSWSSVQAARHFTMRQYLQLLVAVIFMSAFVNDQEDFVRFIEFIEGGNVSYEDSYISGKKFTEINFHSSSDLDDSIFDNDVEIVEITESAKVYYVTVENGKAMYLIANQSSVNQIISAMDWKPTTTVQSGPVQVKLENRYNLTINYPWLIVESNILNIINDGHGYFLVNRDDPNVFGIIALEEGYEGLEDLEEIKGVIDINSNKVAKKISGSVENYIYSDVTLIKKIRFSSYSLSGQPHNLSFGLFMFNESTQPQQAVIDNFERLISTLKIDELVILPKGDFGVIPPVTASDHILGDTNAPVALLVYTDFQTPFYVRHYETLKQILENYGDKVKVVFRHYPLTSIHPNAQKSAEASECAAEQGKFWQYHDILLKSQEANGVTDLKKYAAQLNLNQATFDHCLDSSRYLDRVAKNALEAEAYGLNGIPSTFVGQYLISGANSYEIFKNYIDGVLVEINPDSKIDNIILKFISQEKSLVSRINQNLIDKIKGRILLQVEESGEAWYLDPVSRQKYYLRNGQAAYEAMRKFGLGISTENLRKIPIGFDERLYKDLLDSDGDGLPDKLEEAIGTDPFKADTDGDGYNDKTEIINGYNPLGQGPWVTDVKLLNSLRGRIVLQVESRGEAWYINPTDGRRYFLGDGNMAYQIMRFLSLGIKNAQLREIPVGNL